MVDPTATVGRAVATNGRVDDCEIAGVSRRVDRATTVAGRVICWPKSITLVPLHVSSGLG